MLEGATVIVTLPLSMTAVLAVRVIYAAVAYGGAAVAVARTGDVALRQCATSSTGTLPGGLVEAAKTIVPDPAGTEIVPA